MCMCEQNIYGYIWKDIKILLKYYYICLPWNDLKAKRLVLKIDFSLKVTLIFNLKLSEQCSQYIKNNWDNSVLSKCP